MLRIIGCIRDQHDPVLLSVAVAVCIFACVTSLNLFARARDAAGRRRLCWLTAAAVVFGSGVWTMHFIAELAYRPGMAVGYGPWSTLASLAVAMVLSWFGLWAAVERRGWIVGGGVIGGAIGAMHYTGMTALQVPARLGWDLHYVALSLVIALSLSYAAFATIARSTGFARRVAAALLLTAAIAGLHLVAMSAMVLTPDPTIAVSNAILAPDLLAVAIGAVAVLIIALGLSGWVVDYLIALRVAREAEAVRSSEEHLARAQRLTHTGSVEVDLKKGVTRRSREVSAIYGIDESAAPTTQAEYLALIHPDDREAVSALLIDLDNGIERGPFEHRIVRPDGEVRDIYREHELIHDANGVAVRMVTTVQDVTALRASQRRERELENQLHHSQKMEAIGNLTGGLAHDFNNLLSVVIGNLDLMSGGSALNSADRELVGDALAAALRGAELTRRLLAFARRQPLSPECIDVNERLTGTTALLRRTLGENIAVTERLEGALWPVVVDPAQLEAALTNLATNARDAMPQGGKLAFRTANLRVDAESIGTPAALKPGAYVVIEVTDTGTGMTPEVLARVFDPFFTTKPVGKGTGLGLSMVFGFIKQSGGHIEATSEPGRGTCFRLYLPCAAGSSVARAVEAPSATAAAGATHGTILVVEDNTAVRRVVTRQLAALGYRILEAADADAALKLLKTERVDLLFTDIVMPGSMNGAELARRAIAARPGLKVLFTSGFPGGVGDEPWRPDGARLLNKPYRREELVRAVHEALVREPGPAQRVVPFGRVA
jgi:PAS domain S-box-containing protein